MAAQYREDATQPRFEPRHKLVDSAARPAKEAQILGRLGRPDEHEEGTDAGQPDASAGEEPPGDGDGIGSAGQGLVTFVPAMAR